MSSRGSNFRRIAVFMIATFLVLPSFANAATFERLLYVGMTGADVSALQQILREKGFYSFPKITTYFGPVTRDALARYQTSVGLPAVGQLGPKTRVILNGVNVLTSTSTSSTASGSFVIARQLALGSQGVDVSALQSFLKERGFYNYPTITGYFGAITAQAVSAFQIANGLQAVGEVGPLTRARIATLSASNVGVSTSTSTPSSNEEADEEPRRRSGGGGGSGNSDNDEEVSDTTAPIISSVTVNPSQTSATVSWTTNELATSQVEYGPTSSYGTATTSTELVTSHTVVLTGLVLGSTYHFRVVTVDVALNQATSTDQVFTTRDFDYYVDSDSGNDSNSGTDEDEAFASFAPLTTLGTLPDGSRIGIKDDTEYQSELVITGDDIVIDTYGSGDKPYIDARDTVTGFTATPGRTNVYQTTITLPGSVKALGNIFEDDTILQQYNNLDSVEANPGSAHVSDWTATTTTLYVHSSDNGNPDSNGETYRYSRRLYAISVTGDGTTISGVRTRGQAHQDGSIAIYGEGAIIEDVRVEDGARHSMYLRTGGVVRNSYFYRGANDLEGSANFIVWNQPDAELITAETESTVFDAGNSGRVISALSAHGDDSTLIASSSHYDPTFIGVTAASDAHAEAMLFQGPTFMDSGGVSFSKVGSEVTINDIQVGSTLSGRLVDATSAAGGTLTVNGGSFAITAIGDGFIRGQSTTQDLNVSLNDLVIDIQGTAISNPRYFTHIRKGVLSINDTEIGPTVGPLFDEFFKVGNGAVGSITGNGNIYPYGVHWNLNGTNRYTLSEWQSASGQDTTSQYSSLVTAVSDDFNRSDENLEASVAWTRVGGATGQAAVRSNKLAFTGTTQTLYHVADQGDVNHWAQYILATTTITGPVFTVVRATDQNNFVGVRQSTTQYQFMKYLAGVSSQPGTSSGITPTIGDEVVISAFGNQFVIYVNKRSAARVVITDAALQTATKAGVVPRSTINNPALDDFSHGVIE